MARKGGSGPFRGTLWDAEVLQQVSEMSTV